MFFMHNNIHGDQVYLRELQNFFFEVLGMMSITHYGCVGDGRTDNYANLQVAIDDANRRGLIYIYVPNGRYMYRGELLNIGDIKFIGNPHAEIINERTGEKIPVEQFGYPKKEVIIIDNSGTVPDVPDTPEEPEEPDVPEVPVDPVVVYLEPSAGRTITSGASVTMPYEGQTTIYMADVNPNEVYFTYYDLNGNVVNDNVPAMSGNAMQYKYGTNNYAKINIFGIRLGTNKIVWKNEDNEPIFELTITVADSWEGI